MAILAQDLELVSRCKEGDSQAFERLVVKYQDRLVNALTHFLGESVTAQDLAQEVFLKAFLRIRDFRGESQFYTWMYAIARNMATSHLRTAARKGRTLAIPQGAEELEAPESLGDDPVRRAMSRDLERTVQQALQALDPDARWIVVMRDIDGRDYEEIAESAGVPVGTVKSRLHRARMQMRQLLEGRV